MSQCVFLYHQCAYLTASNAVCITSYKYHRTGPKKWKLVVLIRALITHKTQRMKCRCEVSYSCWEHHLAEVHWMCWSLESDWKQQIGSRAEKCRCHWQHPLPLLQSTEEKNLERKDVLPSVEVWEMLTRSSHH